MSRRVLIVTYNFPPVGGVGVQRVLSMCKHLPRFGWRAVILTPRQANARFTDASLEKDIPDGIEVIRTPSLEPRSLLRRFIYRRRDGQGQDGDLTEVDTVADSGLLGRLKPFAWRWLLIPDDKIGWLPFAVRSGLSVMRKFDVDVIMSTSTPATCHLIGYFLKKASGKPWLTDFRDLWTLNDYESWIYESRLRLAIDRWMERHVLRSADCVVTVSEGLRKRLEQLSVSELLDKTSVVTNGFEPEDFNSISRNPSEHFEIVYTGSFYGTREDPVVFFRALSCLLEEGEVPRDGVRVRIAGKREPHTMECIARMSLGDVVKHEGWVSHEEALSMQVNASLLLLIIADQPESHGRLTGKLFEYMGSGRPILALVPPEGEAADLIRRGRLGYVLSPDDSCAISRTLLALYRQFEREGQIAHTADEELISEYRRQSQIKKLGRCLDEVAGDKRRSGLSSLGHSL